jgi:hypothetical protein
MQIRRARRTAGARVNSIERLSLSVMARPDKLVCQPPGHAVVRCPFASAPTTPARRVAGTDDSAREDSAIWLESLPDDLKAELVQARERGQVRAGEGSVRHVAPCGHPRHEQVSSRLPSRLVS